MYDDAIEIVKKLKKSGFTAYFAGGWVRDYVLGHPSNDIDIATNATPEEVMAIFKNTVPIGKAFGVVLVIMNEIGYEVASFRRDDLYIDGRRPATISYSTAEEDAKRRDFTINGLFYDPTENKIIDFVGGIEDIHKKIVRAIGDPLDRFMEDRLRMLRAIRFSVRFGFNLNEKTERAIHELAHELYPAVSKERVLQELKKMGEHISFPQAILEMKRLSLLNTIFPPLKEKSYEELQRLLHRLNLSQRISFLLTLSSLFAEHEENEVMTLFEDLKLSAQEKLDLLYGLYCQSLSRKQVEVISSYEWVKFFAHPLSRQGTLLLPALSTSFTKENLGVIKETLNPHIDRKMAGVTLLAGRDLIECGIQPGKKMGELLREGEKASILNNYKSKEEVLNYLKNSPFWPT